MTTLTERYLWGVLRAVPDAQRGDLEPEVRALITDAIEARVAAGESADAAERDALLELGDPEALAARYMDRSLVLLGPAAYLQWKRLLVWLLPLVVTIGVGAALFGAALEGAGLADLVGAGMWAAMNVVIHTVFWVTLAFAFIERVARNESPFIDRGDGEWEELAKRPWTLSDLPELPSGGRLALSDAITTVAGSAAMIAGLLWVQTAIPVTIEGARYAVLNAELRSFWLPWFLVVAGVEIAFTIYVYLSRRYSWTFAATNAALTLAFVVPAIWLLQADEILDRGLMDALLVRGLGEPIRIVTAVVSVSVILVSGWEIVEGVLRARRSRAMPRASRNHGAHMNGVEG